MLDFLEKYFGYAFTLIFIVFVCFLVWGVYENSTSEKIELIQSDWVCTETSQYTTLMPVGKTLVPQFHTQCNNYRRNK